MKESNKNKHSKESVDYDKKDRERYLFEQWLSLGVETY